MFCGCRKVDGEGLSFLAFTDEDCSNWTEQLNQLVSAARANGDEEIEAKGGASPVNRSRESVETSNVLEANKSVGDWYPVKDLGDVSELQTKSESFVTKKIKTRKSRAIRAKTKAKTSKLSCAIVCLI